MAKQKKSTKNTNIGVGDKVHSLQSILDKIEKDYGKGSVMRLGDAPVEKIEVIPTGFISLDYALGVGGLPRGRVVEVFGPESGGKSTLTLHAIAQVHAMGGTAALIDAEHAFDMTYAERLGVNVRELILSQPEYGEQALDILQDLVSSASIDIVVVDSVAALTPRAEIEGSMGDASVGVQARLMSQAMRKLVSMVSKTKTVVVFINQLRSKIGVMFGSPETTTGGNALKFYSSVRIDIRKRQTIKEGDKAIGIRSKIKIAKNKVAPPFRETELEAVNGMGFSVLSDLIDTAVNENVIEKSGSWYSFDGEKIGQGKASVEEFLYSNQKAYKDVYSATYDALYGVIDEEADTGPVEDEQPDEDS